MGRYWHLRLTLGESEESISRSTRVPTLLCSYVYDDFTWDIDGRNYSQFNGKLIPARIPLSTMLSGHLLGLSEEEAQQASTPPRSINRRVYEQICPQNERVYIRRETAQAYLKKIQSPIDLDADTGLDILHGWLAALNSPEYKGAKCIEVVWGSTHIFDIWYAPKILLIASTRSDRRIGCLEMSVCKVCGRGYLCLQPSDIGAGHR